MLPVLMFHFGLSSLPGGFTGVDVFFVISGFVIAGSIDADIHAGRFSIANFYFKRVRRIFPAMLAVILATTVAAVAILLPSDLKDYGKSVAAVGTFVSNIFFWKTSGYFATAAQTKPLLHTWSLAVEEQFYLFAPVLFAAIHRHLDRRWALWLVPILIASFACSVAAVFLGPTAGFFLLPARAWELLLGSLVALCGRPMRDHRATREAAGAIGLALILWGMVTLHESDPFPGWNALFPCVGAALFIQAGMVGPQPLANRLIGSSPFVWIGLISYSLYLVHWPLAAFVRYSTLREPTTPMAFGMLIASIGLAWLSWRFIEQPIRHIPIARRTRVLQAGIATVAGVAAVGGALVLARGLPHRFPDLVERRVPGTEDWGGDHCFNQNVSQATPWDERACTRVHGSHGRILLWGDSFAAQYLPGVIRDARRIDADVLQYTFAGCPPILAYSSMARRACAPFNRSALGLIRTEHVDTVVLAGRWTETPVRTIDRLGQTIATLRAMGLRVFVFGQSPQFATDVQHIDYISGNRRVAAGAAWAVSFPESLNRRVAEQAKGATFIDPMPYLCRGTTCPYRVGQTFLYADYGHFSTAGSLRAVRAYFPAGNRPG